jgi:hypothetical protein
MKRSHFRYVGGVFLRPVVVVQVYVYGFVSFQSQLVDKPITDGIQLLSNDFSVVAVWAPAFFADKVLYELSVQGVRKRDNRVCRRHEVARIAGEGGPSARRPLQS